MSWTPCPKPGKGGAVHKALRLVVQTPNPETHSATNVPVPFVLCGHVERGSDGRWTVVVGKHEHGVVAVSPVAWRQRQALAARHGARTHGARKGPRAAAKPATHAKTVTGRSARSGPATRPRGGSKAKGRKA